jgi:hypothetical protein
MAVARPIPVPASVMKAILPASCAIELPPRSLMRKQPIAGGSAHDILPALGAEETGMTHTRPFDPALFGEAAMDAETAKLNAQMVQLLADQPDWDRRRGGFPSRTPARRRPVPGPGDVKPGASSDDHRQGPRTLSNAPIVFWARGRRSQ